MKYKIERLKKILKKEIMRIISEQILTDPRIPDFLTITKVSISKDLHYCHLFFSMLGNQKKRDNAVHGLNSAAGFIQKIIAQRLALKYTPKIEFRYDQQEEEANKVDQLLNNLTKQRQIQESEANQEHR